MKQDIVAEWLKEFVVTAMMQEFSRMIFDVMQLLLFPRQKKPMKVVCNANMSYS